MQLYVSCISAEKIMSCKKDPEVNQHIKLVNPQCMGGMILFDAVIQLPDTFNITSKHEGIDDIVEVSLSKLGRIELNTRDYRDLTLF